MLKKVEGGDGTVHASGEVENRHTAPELPAWAVGGMTLEAARNQEVDLHPNETALRLALVSRMKWWRDRLSGNSKWPHAARVSDEQLSKKAGELSLLNVKLLLDSGACALPERGNQVRNPHAIGWFLAEQRVPNVLKLDHYYAASDPGEVDARSGVTYPPCVECGAERDTWQSMSRLAESVQWCPCCIKWMDMRAMKRQQRRSEPRERVLTALEGLR